MTERTRRYFFNVLQELDFNDLMASGSTYEERLAWLVSCGSHSFRVFE
jgi:hypothetical protein